MAEEGTFCINGDVEKKAGANASATSTAEAYTNNFIKQAEGRIMDMARSDLKTGYGTLNNETKELLREASSNLAAIYAIQYDMSGFTSRIEAEDMINILTFNFDAAMKILSDQKTITYSGVTDGLPQGLKVKEVDGTPDVDQVNSLIVPNGSLTDNADGSVSIAFGGIGSIVEDTTPQLGGELDCQANSIGFTNQTATGDGTTTIDWGLGNKFVFTFGAFNETFTFTAPAKPGNFLLKMIQDGTGSRTATWPASVKWPSGTAPTLSTAASSVDIISFYYDGTNYYGVGSLDFS